MFVVSNNNFIRIKFLICCIFLSFVLGDTLKYNDIPYRVTSEFRNSPNQLTIGLPFKTELKPRELLHDWLIYLTITVLLMIRQTHYTDANLMIRQTHYTDANLMIRQTHYTDANLMIRQTHYTDANLMIRHTIY